MFSRHIVSKSIKLKRSALEFVATRLETKLIYNCGFAKFSPNPFTILEIETDIDLALNR